MTQCYVIALTSSCMILSGYAFTPSIANFKWRIVDTNFNKLHSKCGKDEVMDRHEALNKILSIPLLTLAFVTGDAPKAEAKISVKPAVAFENLVKARAELVSASDKYLSKKDYDGMRDFFSDDTLNINNYEEYANVLLTSKQLDAESKKEIGTIRRYGVGADVIIMYGGLKGEIDEENESPNYSLVSKSLQRTKDSLDEVISICRSNGF